LVQHKEELALASLSVFLIIFLCLSVDDMLSIFLFKKIKVNDVSFTDPDFGNQRLLKSWIKVFSLTKSTFSSKHT
jgi:hypothetical protein